MEHFNIRLAAQMLFSVLEGYSGLGDMKKKMYKKMYFQPKVTRSKEENLAKSAACKIKQSRKARNRFNCSASSIISQPIKNHCGKQLYNSLFFPD